MLQGLPLIIKPPGKTTLLQYPTYFFTNKRFALYWSDGKCEAPMLPEKPLLCKNPEDGSLFWLDDCKNRSRWKSRKYRNHHDDWNHAKQIELPSDQDYLAAIGTELTSSRRKMYYVRQRCWWAANDILRDKIQTSLSAEHLKNLSEFVKMIWVWNQSNRLLKADALRQLSRFDEALSLLDYQFSKAKEPSAKIIRELATKKHPRVTALPHPDSSSGNGKNSSSTKWNVRNATFWGNGKEIVIKPKGPDRRKKF